ncbi:MAG TPA: hypothetical protein VG944_02255 [Fimbriimonas sp.]|nr:hypothetical protein [Fimbriimonas sp.]
MNVLGLAAAVALYQTPPAQPVLVQFAKSMVGRNVTVCIDGNFVENTFAGKLGFREATRSWVSICANVRAPIVSGQFYTVHPKHTSKLKGRMKLAGNIVAKYFRLAQTPDQCAGLQIAVWEAIEDGGATPDFSTGRFRVRANQEALQYAAMYYAAVQQEGDAVFLGALEGDGAEDIGDGGQDGQGDGDQGGGGQSQLSE